jgi:thioredoxin reductase
VCIQVVVDTAGVLKELQFNALIICTGTNYPHFKEDGHQTLEQRGVFYFDCNEKIRKSENICIVGGGASGCELAGEIRNCFPEKNITLVHSKERVLPVRFISAHISYVWFWF